MGGECDSSENSAFNLTVISGFFPFRWRGLVAVVIVLIAAMPTSRAKEEKRVCPMGRDYFLYTPDVLDAAKTYWLVVGVHGYRGSGQGAGRLSGWINKGNVIVVGPSFPNEGYQVLAKDSDRQLIDIFKGLRKEYRLHPKFFISGFSGGSQYAHRFALAYPDYVIGCAAHSGGTWAEHPDVKALGVPFALSCGENDTGKSVPTAPLGRLEWFKDFVRKMNEGSYYFKARTWPGVGHGASPGSARMTEECFNLSTTGMLPEPLLEFTTEIRKIEEDLAASRQSEATARLRKLSTLALAGVPAHTWASKDGARTFDGALKSYDPASGAVSVIKPDGTVMSFHQDKLSAADVTFLKAQGKANAPASNSQSADRSDVDKQEGNPLPGVREESCGWRVAPAGKAALEEVRQAFLKETLKDLSARVAASAKPRVQGGMSNENQAKEK